MSASSVAKSSHHQQRNLIPNRTGIIIGYAHDAKSGKAEKAIQDGAVVIIWSFVHMELFVADDDDALSQQQQQQLTHERGRIRTELDLEEIQKIRDKYDTVLHLAAFGGWNGPHPPVFASSTSECSSMTGKQWFDIFLQFNKLNGYLFDGIDWDYEGHDDLTSPTATFTLETLDVMADFSVEAKKHGMVVSMAPCESYLDASIIPNSIDSKFSLALDFPPRAWSSDRYHASEEDRELIKSKGFSHAGRQCYAYVLAKAGVDTFDWISIQLYESYSPFAHDLHRRKLDPSEALMIRIRRLIQGYTVTDLPLELSASSSSSSEYEVKIPPTKLVVGIANGWADGLKACKVEPYMVQSAYESTISEYGEGFLGVMFWTIEEEGNGDDDNNNDESRLTKSLSREFQSINDSNEL